MKQLLRDLPFYKEPQLFYLEPLSLNKHVQISHYQIPVRVSLGVYLLGAAGFLPTVPSLPAVLDTGFNGGLALSASHLREWAGIAPAALGREVRAAFSDRPTIIKGFAARAFDGKFYIRPNRPRTWESADESLIEVTARILVLDASQDGLRLPLLGKSALDQLGRKLTIDYRRRLVQL